MAIAVPIRIVVLQGRQQTVIGAYMEDGKITDCVQAKKWIGKTPEEVRTLLGEDFLTWEEIHTEDPR